MSMADINDKPTIFGVTGPISTAEPSKHDLDLTKQLQEYMSGFGVYESEIELSKRLIFVF